MMIPCWNCSERVTLCHSTCDKYQKWHDWNEQRKEAVARDRVPVLNEYDFSYAAGRRRKKRY